VGNDNDNDNGNGAGSPDPVPAGLCAPVGFTSLLMLSGWFALLAHGRSRRRRSGEGVKAVTRVSKTCQ
jgi:hypothetical protein